MNRAILSTLAVFSFSQTTWCNLENLSLYIVSDSLTTVDNLEVPYTTFNTTIEFTQDNPKINLMVGDTLNLWVVNKDTIEHEFRIKGVTDPVLILPEDSALVEATFNSPGSFIYHDPLNYPKNTYLGLGGMINVKDHLNASFYWNIKEHNSEWNYQLFNNEEVVWSEFSPKYFTINSVSNPNVNQDTTARVTGSVGDTLYLYIANTGLSIHSIHFHGYHAEIKYSSRHSNHAGRSKDTFPVYPMETLVLEIIPDKEGEYPLHDHNLVAVTGNNLYPNGMFSTILITP